jgi:glycosyltransferase involved in cell wall biosynthesis
MKVAFVCRYPWSLQFGGAEIQAQHYIDGLRSLGVECDFIDMYSKESHYDIVHCMGLNLATEAVVSSAKRMAKRVVISPIYYVTPDVERKLVLASRIFGYRFDGLGHLRNALLGADAIFPNSKEEARQLSKLFSVDIGAMRVIYNGVDSGFFTPGVADKNRESLPVVSVAMIDRRKNTLGLIEAFLKAGIKNKLILVGGYRAGNSEYISKVIQQVQDNPQIEHLGFIQDFTTIRQIYRQASVHVLASSLETPGLSSLEAMACGVPCVLGDCRPVREYFGDNGIYVNHKSTDSIADGIKRALQKQPSAEIISANVGKFGWANICKELLDQYENILKITRSGR